MLSIVSLFVLVSLLKASNAADCYTKFSEAIFRKNFNYSASSERIDYTASDVFTFGWCAATNTGTPYIDVDFTLPYGISGITIQGPTNKDTNPYPTNVLVKYVPNEGDTNNFIHFPLQEGKLEIKLNQPGQAQSNFAQSIAVRKLRFIIQSFSGEACLKIDLTGCTINELCSGGCQQNGGLCVMEDTCRCPQGSLGDNCELKACVPATLGLADGRIGADQVTASSQDPVHNEAEIGYSNSKKGWCPALTDQSPWVQIKLDQPKAVSVFEFTWSGQGGNKILTEFELQYIAAIDSTRRFRTYATDIPAMNGTHIFSVTIEPAVVTDTIRIVPSKWDNRPCFKLEIQGCDPKEVTITPAAVTDTIRIVPSKWDNRPCFKLEIQGCDPKEVTITPAVVTDTIRIVPSKWDNKPCFKLEIQGCDPKALCSNNWCLNGGSCIGQNVCKCPYRFVGSRCEQATSNITVTNMTFAKIENNIIVTTTATLQFLVTGNVNLQVIENKPVVSINGLNSCITLNQTTGTPSCVTDINLCTNGFTFTIDVKFGQLLDNTYIISSGGNLPDHSGITLYYANNELHYIVSTTTQIWTVAVNYSPVLHQWQHFELTWNKHLGIEILVNGHTLGSKSRPSRRSTSSKTTALAVGCSHSSSVNVNTNMQVTAINLWTLDRTELVNAGVLEPSEIYTTSGSSTVTSPPYSTTSTTSGRLSTDRMTSTSTPSMFSEASTTLKPTIGTTASVSQWQLQDAIKADCTGSGWNISLDLHILQLLYPGITANNIYMSPAKCHGTIHDNRLLFQQIFDTCMTTEKVVDGATLFQNSLFYAIFDPIDPTIVRRHSWTYNVACYVSTGESASAHLHHEVENHSTNMTGHHDIALTFYRDPNFLHQITGDPVRVAVGDNVYVKVVTAEQDLDTKMRLHTCYTKLTDKSAEHLLIRDGCEVDSSTHIISQSTHETKFVFRDFEFLTFNEGLDIYCNATFCHTSDFTPACAQACRQDPSLVG